MPTAAINNILLNSEILSTRDLSELINYIDTSKDIYELMPNGPGCDLYENGQPVSVKTVSFYKPDKKIQTVLDNLTSSLKKHVEFEYGQRLFLDPNFSGRIWSEGDYQSPHSDSEYNNATLCLDIDDSQTNWTNNIPRFLSDYSSLVYLNDNYEGGELVFPEYNLNIKPKAGDIITFPTNAMYLHAVNKIKSGTRYNVVLKWFRQTTLISHVIPKNKAIQDLVKSFDGTI